MLPMFNQGSRSSLLYHLPGGTLTGQTGGFTYNDSPYTHALNRALQLESVALTIYVTRQRLAGQGTTAGGLLAERLELHNAARRHLVRMIVAQRGLPDSEPASFMAITSSITARASQWMPELLQTPLLEASTQRIEMALIRRYDALLEIAPPCDQETISALREQARDFSRETL